MAGKLVIKQVKSPAGSNRRQLDALRTLGLGRIGKRTERPDDPSVRGQLAAVRHLIVVNPRDDEKQGSRGEARD